MRVVAAVFAFALVIGVAVFFNDRTSGAAVVGAGLHLEQIDGQSVLSADGLGEVYRSTAQVSKARMLSYPNSSAKTVLWRAGDANFYSISLDGKSIARTVQADYKLMLRYAEFDPLVSIPRVPFALGAHDAKGGGEKAFIVQFATQPLDQDLTALSGAGAKVHIYLPNYAYLVSMTDAAYAAVANLPSVRWIGRYEPAYRLDEALLAQIVSDPSRLGRARYNIMAVERGEAAQRDIGSLVAQVGGTVDNIVPEGLRMEATLTGEQLLEIAHHEKVMFIDPWSAPEHDMDVVRNVSGANFVDTVGNFRGQGVRAEVMDGGLLTTHNDFQPGGAPILHGSVGVDSHGTATYGINFGRGVANPAGKGMLPEAQGIIAAYTQLTNRYTHTSQLLQDPYKAVYQSNSWGSALTTQYTTISAEMDDILFQNDFTLLNSQSNAGTQNSRPQAWAKNVVSIGGIRHFNTPSFTDDRWQSGASIGPAADGRVKPDLAHFYDSVFTTTSSSNTAYTSGFGGTSAATPITAGHFGLFFQMWHERLFGNPVGGPTVFDSRPHMSTAKAVMINTAEQWDMTIPGTDITRVRQGFGRVDIANLYKLRGNLYVVNEAHALTNLQTKSYDVAVVADSLRAPLKITMVYTDPMGSPGATRTRINDLTLKVTAPDGTVYWGNNGIGVGGGMYSTPGGTANIVDTVENVFINNAMIGIWRIEVIASEVVADARPETPGVNDADYALVVSGPLAPGARARMRFERGN
jgi:hypothetical protein